MRASEVRSAIIRSIEDTRLDGKARAGDHFAVLRSAREPTSARERVCLVRLIEGPDRSDDNSCDAFTAVYQVAVFYGLGDVDDRIAADNERIAVALADARLIEIDSDVMGVALSSTSVEEGESVVITRRDVRVLYRLDAAVMGG